MTVEGERDISELIAAWGSGDEDALGRLMPVVYPELRRIARQHLGRQQAGQTLESAALANEAYLKLTRAGGIRCENRVHFLALCSQIIRRILVDHVRNRLTAKRGAGALTVTLDDAVSEPVREDIDLVRLDDALLSLAAKDEQQSRVVELRFFGGLSIEETAEVLGISASTVKRDWAAAKAWLYRDMSTRISP